MAKIYYMKLKTNPNLNKTCLSIYQFMYHRLQGIEMSNFWRNTICQMTMCKVVLSTFMFVQKCEGLEYSKP